MLDLGLNPTVNQLQIIVAVLLLACFGVAYAAVVRHLRRRDPDHSYTAVLVVFGVGGVIIAFSVLTSLAAGALLLGLFSAAGLPMVFEYTDFRLKKVEGRRRADGIRELTEGTNGLQGEGGGIQLAKNGSGRPH